MHDVQLLRLRAVTAQHFFVEIIRQLCLVAGKLDEHPLSVIDGNSNAINRNSRLAYMENLWRQEILMDARIVDFRVIDVRRQRIPFWNNVRETVIVKRAFHRQDGARILFCDDGDLRYHVLRRIDATLQSEELFSPDCCMNLIRVAESFFTFCIVHQHHHSSPKIKLMTAK